MSSFRFLHAADLHLDSPLRGIERYEGAPVEAIRNATRRAFENLVATAIAESVAFVILAGDVFDGDWRDFNTGLFFARQLRALGDAGIRVYLLAGNHDAAAHMTRQIEWPANVTVFATKAPQSVVDEATGAVLHGQGFPTRAVEHDLAAGYPVAHRGALNIGVLHTALEGRDGHERYAPCTTAGLRAKGYDYWALGHVHAREVVAEAPWIVFPGNLQGRHIRETGSKGATLVTVEDGIVASVEHVALDVLRWTVITVDVADAKSRDAALDQARHALARARDVAEGRTLVARVVLAGRSDVDAALRSDREAALAALRDEANALGEVWIESLRLATSSNLGGTGKDLIDALALDDTALRANVLASVQDDELRLLGAVQDEHEDRDGLLRTLLDEARELAVRRLLDAAASPGRGTSR
ncbi:MAG: DNA repair exonuclease [Planctomycetes bacterium]|nr:DNA repair exonuclease [Planctomycetota bacterium]